MDEIVPKVKDTSSQHTLNAIIACIKNDGKYSSEIAELLGIDEQSVVSCLYQNIGTKFYQDNHYVWREKKKLLKADTEKPIDLDLYRIISYYLDCVVKDSDEEFKCFAKSGYNNQDYIQLKTIPRNDSAAEYNGSLSQLKCKVEKSKNSKEIMFGYPVYLRKHVSMKNEKMFEYFTVEPLFAYSTREIEGELLLDGSLPILNSSVLKAHTVSEDYNFALELAELEGELGFLENVHVDVDDIVRRLRSIRGNWDWKQEPDSYMLDSSSQIADIREEGIYNKAIFFLAERAPFTRGLKSELATLSKMSRDDIKGTALSKILGFEASDNIIPGSSEKSLLEVLPLNREQKKAALQAIYQDTTVVTGPPGTGKSQLITNIIINAVWNNQSVLFTSKNNRAVDVVEERMNAQSDRPVLLRAGSGERAGNLAKYLLDIINQPIPLTSDIEEYDYLIDRYNEINQLQENNSKLLTNLISLKNLADYEDQKVDTISSDYGAAYVRRLRLLNMEKAKMLRESYDLLSLKISQLDRNKQNRIERIVSYFMKSKWTKELSQLMLLISESAISTSDEAIDLAPSVVNAKNLKIRLGLQLEHMETIENQRYALAKLYKHPPLEKLFGNKYQLGKDAVTLSQKIWQLNAKIMPSRMSGENIKQILKYKTTLKLAEHANDLYKDLGAKLYLEYKNLSKTAVKYLPAWATTSLSARGSLSFEKALFDIVIFDEASQCDIASALPLLYRSKRAVIIGDPKQLSHITRITTKQEIALLQKFHLENQSDLSYSVNSLYELARSKISVDRLITLRDHHRSHGDIIGFSNKYFYGDQLRVMTNYNQLAVPEDERGVDWVECIGSVLRPKNGSAVNEIEAVAVVEELNKIVSRGFIGTIGVATPFRAQANKINQLISYDKGLSAALTSKSFVCDVVHRLQGDEKDVIIFSTVVSEGMHQGALKFLRQQGNLFNVAITRAKSKLILVGDYKFISKYSNIPYLTSFIDWLDKKKEFPITPDGIEVSDWEKMLYEALSFAGIQAVPQYSDNGHYIDLALFDPNNERKLAIEVDGELYHREWTGELMLKDEIINESLIENGWDVKRFWVYEIRDNMDKCVSEIGKWLHS